MQPDRRHELEHNDLAASVATLTEKIRPYLGTIGLAVAAVVIGSAAWTLVESRRVATRQESWDACLAALASGQAAALDAVAARYPGTPAAQWSRLVTADGLLDQGSQLLATDRGQAEQRLQGAVTVFSGLLAERPLDFVAERATFGLAKARENLGSIDDAIRGYATVVKEYPGSAVRPFAEGRIADLGRQSTRQWYDWFAQQKPAPPANADGATPAATPASPGSAEPAAERPADAGSGTGAPG